MAMANGRTYPYFLLLSTPTKCVLPSEEDGGCPHELIDYIDIYLSDQIGSTLRMNN